MLFSETEWTFLMGYYNEFLKVNYIYPYINLMYLFLFYLVIQCDTNIPLFLWFSRMYVRTCSWSSFLFLFSVETVTTTAGTTLTSTSTSAVNSLQKETIQSKLLTSVPSPHPPIAAARDQNEPSTIQITMLDSTQILWNRTF